ncbi:unnamed protein product [Nezara viridula]|uniref:Uncharacterized protein n=1 Tax=Nezara viridula TaxID=85310 RepID=A0A9P0GXG6_NEZVI|nr:unnamed protein product [Nezara viridula]
MNQWLFLIVLVTCVSYGYGQDNAEEIQKLKDTIFRGCAKQFNLEDAAFDDLYHARSVDKIKDKCVLKCILDKYGLIKGDKLEAENLSKSLAGHWKDKARTNRIIQATLDCFKKVPEKPDICAMSYDAFFCFFDVVQKEHTEYGDGSN